MQSVQHAAEKSRKRTLREDDRDEALAKSVFGQTNPFEDAVGVV